VTREEKWFWALLVATCTTLGLLTLAVKFEAPPLFILCAAPLGQWVCGYVFGRHDEIKRTNKAKAK